MARPTLTMIPSGYKAQKVYSVLPTNGDGDFTFDRTTTATRVNKDGLIEQVATDVPRLDYSDGSCPSLLLEPSSVNLALYSQDFSQSDWSVFDVSKSANSVLSPDGTLNGARITALDGTNKALQQLVTVSADPSNDRVFTGSIYIKSSSVTSCFLRVGSATSNNAITITSEWQRFESTAQQTLTSSICGLDLRGGIASTSDILVYGIQIEQQPYATSYIPTSGASSTRLRDLANGSGNSTLINSTEGTLYVEIARNSNEGSNGGIQINDGSIDNSIRLFFNQANTISVITRVGGSNNVVKTAQGITSSTAMNKFALVYKLNDYKLYYNGNLLWSDTTAIVYPVGTLNNLDFLNQTTPFNGEVKAIAVYKEALTDAQLTLLTTI